MFDLECPWCEAELTVARAGEPEQTCPECLTAWAYVDESADQELALAA